MRISVDHESKGKKCCIAVGQCIHFVVAATIGIIYIVFMWSVWAQ